MSFDSFFNFCSYVLAYEQQLVRAGWGVGGGEAVCIVVTKPCHHLCLYSNCGMMALCGFVNDKIAS